MVIAAGIGGSITGHGAATLIIDDPVKNRAAADSEIERDGAWGWFTEMVYRLAEAVCEPLGRPLTV